MMALDFNVLFGYENILNEKVEIVIFGAFFIPIALLIIVAMIGGVFRKLKINMYIIHAFLYTLLFTFLFGIFTILVLFLITDRDGVKLAYCWLAVFVGMLFFSLINTNTITKMFTDWSKIIKK